ncbi:MAG: hypothetical protein AAF225_13575 [Pseudomonadota bacterium]
MIEHALLVLIAICVAFVMRGLAETGRVDETVETQVMETWFGGDWVDGETNGRLQST